MRLNLVAPAATIDAADTDTRVIRGIAVPYGQPGNTSAGRVTIDAGAIRVPDQLRRVKLFLEHGRAVPTGHGLDAADSPDALRMGFQIGRTPDGDRALLEASEGIRDALSVELDNVVIRAGHVTSADLVAVAQVAVPAFSGAQLAATDTDPETTDDGDQAGDEDTDDAETDADDTTTEETPVSETTTVEAAASAASMNGMRPTARAADPGADGRLWAAAAAEALRGATDAAQVNAALADITPANAGTTDVFPRPAWLGQLWTPQAVARPLVEAIGVAPLTAMKMQGWKWITEPEVSPYAGNKAAIPTSPAVIGPAEAPAQRIAGGWDMDRIYLDFNTGFMEAFQAAAVRDYRKKSQSYFVNGHAAIVGPPAVPAADGFLADATDLGSAPDLLAGLQSLIGFLTGNGATVSFIAMASDAYQEFFALSSSEAPWWLSNQASINLNGTSEVASTTIVVDPDLAPGTVVAGDRDAVSLWETGPINVTAVNLPNGGIDFALFGYWAQMVHDDDGLAKVTIAAAAADAAAAPRRSRKTTAPAE